LISAAINTIVDDRERMATSDQLRGNDWHQRIAVESSGEERPCASRPEQVPGAHGDLGKTKAVAKGQAARSRIQSAEYTR